MPVFTLFKAQITQGLAQPLCAAVGIIQFANKNGMCASVCPAVVPVAADATGSLKAQRLRGIADAVRAVSPWQVTPRLSIGLNRDFL
jgi:hypothetical protein